MSIAKEIRERPKKEPSYQTHDNNSLDNTRVKIDLSRNCKDSKNSLKRPSDCFRPEQFANDNLANCPKTCEIDKLQIIDAMKAAGCFPDFPKRQSRKKIQPRLTGT